MSFCSTELKSFSKQLKICIKLIEGPHIHGSSIYAVLQLWVKPTTNCIVPQYLLLKKKMCVSISLFKFMFFKGDLYTNTQFCDLVFHIKNILGTFLYQYVFFKTFIEV